MSEDGTTRARHSTVEGGTGGNETAPNPDTAGPETAGSETAGSENAAGQDTAGEHDGLRSDTPEARWEEEMSAVETGDAGPTPAPDGDAPYPEAAPASPAARAATWTRRIPQVLALAVVWVLLWGSLTPTAIIGGLLIGLVVTMLFPLPLLPDRLPFRPLKSLRLLVYLAIDLTVSGVRVSMVTLVRGPRARAGILGLPLYTDSDRAVTTIVAGCALTPGSYVLQIDRRRRRWYVYVLGLHREGSVERVRGQLMNLQMRVIDALGSDEEVRRCRQAVAAGRDGEGGPQ